MPDFLKELSAKAEFAIIISLCFGYPIICSLLSFISSVFYVPIGGSFTNEVLVSVLIYEAMTLMTAYAFLKIRENPIDYKNGTSLFNVIWTSVLLAVFYYLTYLLIVSLAYKYLASVNSEVPYMKNSIKLNPFLILGISIVNPVFEELIVVGYVIPALSRQKGLMFAINVSVLIRFLYHLYQGPAAALSVIPMGLIFAFVYTRWKNIWPLIIAHAIMDFIGLICI